MKPRVLLVNPNTADETTAMMQRMAKEAFSGIGLQAEVIGITVTSGPSMLVDPDSLALARKHTVTRVLEHLAGDSAFDGIIVGAFGDPGVTELRSRVTIPVAGIGESSIVEAAGHGSFAIATTTPALKPSICRQVETLGLADVFLGVEFTQGDPLTLAMDQRQQTEALGGTVTRSVAKGARAVVIGGGPLALSAETLSKEYRIPVINPVRAACKVLAESFLTPSRAHSPAPSDRLHEVVERRQHEQRHRGR